MSTNSSRTGMATTSGAFGVGPNAPKQCTAISKRSKERCKGPAVANSPTQKCRMHGGNVEGHLGTKNHQFKDGRHSKFLPPRLNDLYTQALDNPELTDMADHIALLEAHMQEVLAISASGDPCPQWSNVKEAFDEVATAALGGKQEEVVAAVERYYKLLEAGEKWDRTWNQVLDVMEQLRKMTDTDVKRRKDLGLMVPVERVMVLMAAVGQAVKRNVTNPSEIEAVHRELTQFTLREKSRKGEQLVPLPSSRTVIDVGVGADATAE